MKNLFFTRITIILCLVVIGGSCFTPHVTPDSQTSNSPSYVVSLTGERNNPSQNSLTPEYSIYYSKSLQDRKLYLGGEFGGEPWYYVWIDFDDSKYRDFIDVRNRYTLNSTNYFGQSVVIDNSKSVLFDYQDFTCLAHYGNDQYQDKSGVSPVQ